MSNFAFLKTEWALIHESAFKAESAINSDPRTACFYSRRTLELVVAWLYRSEKSLKFPYQENLSALIHEPTFKMLVGAAIFDKARLITRLGNHAVHSSKPVQGNDALISVKELFHITYWLSYNYAKVNPAKGSLQFELTLVPNVAVVQKQTAEQLLNLQAELSNKDESLKAQLASNITLSEEIRKLREEIVEIKKKNTKVQDDHDYSEEETRDYFIDLLLKEAGWTLAQQRDREYEVQGMPNNHGVGYVDYVLWGDDGKPLALVEAKRTKRNPREGQQQAWNYADCLEKEFGQRPVIYYTNGYTHWMWDNHNYPPREVQGFYKKDELQLLIQRRQSRRQLAGIKVNSDIAGRFYQERAIKKVCESFDKERERKALLVMATGSGKTRTVIGLSDLLINANWAKRILFLADRTALVNQAHKNYGKHLPNANVVNLLKKNGEDSSVDGRIFFSTYQTMMGLIDESKDGQRRFGVGHFDLIVIDEAHRSIFQKYRMIFDYFDSLLVGLTATPRDEIDRNTYELFDLDDGVPTDAYDLAEAVKDKYLVKSVSISVPLKFQREGIKYEELSEEEQEHWDEQEWDDEAGDVPEAVDGQDVNTWLFNTDTVDKVLEHLMTCGQKVQGGDVLGKTIIFAKNQAHAEFIEERFNINYPNLKGEFARIITNKTEYAQSLIDTFSVKAKWPQIAISVDMLDTGIDVPEIVNLVFFKVVRSRTKFWQMVGRGTRTCENLFGPGQHKQFFYIFDFCQNLEFFSQNPETSQGALGKSLKHKIFDSRVALIQHLEKNHSTPALKSEIAEVLRDEVSAMNTDNFIVRTQRKLVEKYRLQEVWSRLSDEDYAAILSIAGFPSELDPESEDAKRFDYLMLRLQLALLKGQTSFQKLAEKVKETAELLAEKSNIPLIAQQMEVIGEVLDDAWWDGVTLEMLENVRKKLRGLVIHIEKTARNPVYTSIEDEIGEGAEVLLPQFATSTGLEKFREKAKAFLLQNQNDMALIKLRTNRPLAPADIQHLETILSGLGDVEVLAKAKEESSGLGLFVRSLVGLDREAAKMEFNRFLSDKNLTANQNRFIDEIINHLTTDGAMEPDRLYESPFTDISPTGPDGLFGERAGELVSILDHIRNRALG
ncbi:DEAD/DEAH box helicase family protein [Bdellovibrio bacteriovorus]|uniref:DEAD/DEAH box helicase family protein n=1 Tax=Bdellovibrio bacteriovorus TaxID=959 RepID=UPI0035A64463